MRTSDLQLGPGLSFAVQFHFNNNIYLFSRTSVAIDIMRWHKLQIYDDANDDLADHDHGMEMIWGWMVRPSIGIGVKF